MSADKEKSSPQGAENNNHLDNTIISIHSLRVEGDNYTA